MRPPPSAGASQGACRQMAAGAVLTAARWADSEAPALASVVRPAIALRIISAMSGSDALATEAPPGEVGLGGELSALAAATSTGVGVHSPGDFEIVIGSISELSRSAVAREGARRRGPGEGGKDSSCILWSLQTSSMALLLDEGRRTAWLEYRLSRATDERILSTTNGCNESLMLGEQDRHRLPSSS